MSVPAVPSKAPAPVSEAAPAPEDEPSPALVAAKQHLVDLRVRGLGEEGTGFDFALDVPDVWPLNSPNGVPVCVPAACGNAQ